MKDNSEEKNQKDLKKMVEMVAYAFLGFVAAGLIIVIVAAILTAE